MEMEPAGVGALDQFVLLESEDDMSRIPAAQRPQRRRQKATAADPGSYRRSRQDPLKAFRRINAP